MKLLNKIDDYLIDKTIDFIIWVVAQIPPDNIARFAMWVDEEGKKYEKDNTWRIFNQTRKE